MTRKKQAPRDLTGIRQRGSTYQIRVSAGYGPVTGRQMFLSGSADTEDAAIVIHDRLRAQVRENTAARTNVTLGYLLDQWLSGHQVEETTRATYRNPHGRGCPQDPGSGGVVHRLGGAAVTISAAVGAAGRVGLLEKLLAAVRPEFRVDVLAPDPDNPVLGVKCCTVDGCDRSVHEKSLCTEHSLRWRGRGRPSLAEFRADPGPPLRGRIEPGSCTVTGCRFGTSGRGLCARHRDKWTRAGRPDPVAWAASVPAMDPAGRIECKLSFCGLWTENDKNVFCKSHTTHWRNLGFPDIEQFVADCERHGQWFIDFRVADSTEVGASVRRAVPQ